MSQRPATEPGHRGHVGQLPQKLMDMSLERLEAFLEHQEHKHGEGQDALPGEVAGATAMSRPEARIDEWLTQSFNKVEGTAFEEDIVLHPQCTSRMYLHCTF